MMEQKASQKSEKFSFTPENWEKAKKCIEKYPQGRQASAVLALLDLAQRQCGGWVPHPAIEEIAAILDMPSIRVHEVATFYTMFNLKPVGKYHLQICGTTPCLLRGAEDIKNTCKKSLGIEMGQVTPDNKFSLVEVECLGACVNAPVVQINDDYFEDLTPEVMQRILQDLSEDKACQPGSAVGRQASAPEGMIKPGGKSNAA